MPSKLHRTVYALVASVGLTLAVSACGSTASVGDAASDYSPIEGSNIHVAISAWPQSLDPQADSSTQGTMLNWQVYTGLTTFAHASGAAGTQAIPGLATALPSVGDHGRTYTVTLRSGLVFSNGRKVQAADFAYTVERAIRLHWSGAGAFIEPLITGARAYARGDADAISGIVTDNDARTVTIHLTHPFPSFDDVLAQPALGLIPTGTPMRAQTLYPPPGVGPYVTTNVVPGATLQLTQNPYWAQMRIPGIPGGHTSINVRLDSDVGGAALSVLNNSADLLDPANTIPTGLMDEIKRLAPNRLHVADAATTTDYVFMNVTERPFNNPLVRRAVAVGIDRGALLSDDGRGWVQPGCTLLPPGVAGHATVSSCSAAGNLSAARALIKRSGDAGAPVTVWTPPTTPDVGWMSGYRSFLNAIGLRAKLRVVDTALFDYFTRTGSDAARAQTGFGSWSQSFPSPLSFYGTLLYGGSILAANNRNLSQVNDPAINSALTSLGAVADSTSPATIGRWHALEGYTDAQNYIAVIGYQTAPYFASDRIIWNPKVMTSPIYGWDLSQVQLTATYSGQ